MADESLYKSSEKCNSKLPDEVKNIIVTVLNNCKAECDSQKLQLPIGEYVNRTALYTGYPKSTIQHIITSFNQSMTRYKAFKFPFHDRMLLLQTLKNFYAKKTTITYKNVYKKIKCSSKQDWTFDDFHSWMIGMGFKYADTTWGRTIVEDPKLVFERYNYLHKINRIRTKGLSNIYYMDVRIIDQSLKFVKSKNINNTEGYFCFHIVSKIGCESILFCNQAAREHFKKWIVDMVLPNLKPNSTIVIEKNFIYNPICKLPITPYSSKDVMIKWLNDNNVPCSNSMRKAELYYLIKKFNDKNNSMYLLDSIFEAYGHEILRLPSNYNDCSPTELLWRYISTENRLTEDEKGQVFQIKDKINTMIKHMSHQKWQEFDKTIQCWEREAWRIDEQVEKYLSEFQFTEVIDKNDNIENDDSDPEIIEEMQSL